MPIRHNMLGSIPTDTERTFITLADGQVGTLSCSVHENVLNPEAIVPWHLHPVEEVIVCMSGVGECTFQDCAPAKYRAGSVLIIPPNTPHTLRNVGPDRLSQLAILGGIVPGTQWMEPEGSVAKAERTG